MSSYIPLNKKLNLICFAFIIFAISFQGNLYAKQVNNNKEKSIDWFWFFYEHTSDSSGSTDVYRPFYMEAEYGDNLFQASLMPLLFWRYKSIRNDVTYGFFGFYESTDYKHSGKERDYDSGLFPLFLYGSGDKEKDKYLFIYPLGGSFHGKFGYDRISPYVFPGVALFFIYHPAIFSMQAALFALASIIPVYTEFENRDYNGTALFWPFIAWGKGEKREDFRFLPFYAHNSKKGWYDNYQYLLLINYRELYLKDDERYTFFFLPFYGRKWNKKETMKSHTVLWPFFSWGYDEEKNERIYNLPWPLVQIGDSDKPKMKKRIFWPFYGTHETSTYESMFVTPLYFRIKKDQDDFKSEYHITCIIAWYLKRDYAIKHEYYGNSWRYFKLWPLLQVEWSDSGMYSVNVLSLLPFRDTRGYEKLYQPFWTLYEYRRKPDGEKHLGLLLRTYYQVWSDDFFKMKIPLVINYESRGDTVTEFTMLLSSFGYEKDREGAYLKLFWIPLKIGQGDETLALKNDNEDIRDNEYKKEDKVDEADDLQYNEKIYGFNPSHWNAGGGDLYKEAYFKMDFRF
jgi:hypothetical protein